MNWLGNILFAFFSELLLGFLETFKTYINNIFSTMYDLTEKYLNFDQINKYTVGIGIGLVSVYAIKQGIDVYVLHTEGDPDADPLELITRIAQSVAVIVCGEWCIDFLIEKSAVFCDEVLSHISTSNAAFTTSTERFINLLVGNSSIVSLILLIAVIIMVVSYVMLIFKAGKRGAELILFKILIPIIAIDLLTTNRERWNSFINELFICVFGYIVQMLSFTVFMELFVHAIDKQTNIELFMASLAWLMVVLGAPKWLQKITYSSGVANSTKGGARTATYILPTIVRSIK